MFHTAHGWDDRGIESTTETPAAADQAATGLGYMGEPIGGRHE